MSSSHNRHKINSEHAIYNDISLRKDTDMKNVFSLDSYLQVYNTKFWTVKNIYSTIYNFSRYKMFTDDGEKEKFLGGK